MSTVLTLVLATAVSLAALGLRWDRHRRRLVPAWRRRRHEESWLQRWLRRSCWTGLAVLVAAPLLAAPSVANPFQCKEPPEIDEPGRGMTGELDPGASVPDQQGSPATAYGDFGYAGQVWHTYDLGCAYQLSDPVAPMATAAANWLFNVTKVLAAFTNGLHYLLLDDGAFGWLSQLTETIAESMWDGVFTVWIPLVLVFVAIVLLWLGTRGDAPAAAKRSLWALVGFWVAASAALMPVTYEGFFREHLVALTGAAQAGYISPDSDPRAEVREQADRFPDTVMRRIVFDSWVAGELGHTASEDATAQHYGTLLLDTQACSKAEAADNRCDRQQKQERFEQVAEEIKQVDGSMYAVLTGKDYSPRLSAAALSFYQALYIYLFQLVSKLVIVLSLLTIAVMIMLMPVVGMLGMLNPESLRASLKAFGTAFLNAVLMGLFGGLHTRLVLWGAESLPNLLIQSLFLGGATIVMLLISRPIKRIASMLQATMQVAGVTDDGGGGRGGLATALLLSRLAGRGRGRGRTGRRRSAPPEDPSGWDTPEEHDYPSPGDQPRWQRESPPEEQPAEGAWRQPPGPARPGLVSTPQDPPVWVHAQRTDRTAGPHGSTSTPVLPTAGQATLPRGDDPGPPSDSPPGPSGGGPAPPGPSGPAPSGPSRPEGPPPPTGPGGPAPAGGPGPESSGPARGDSPTRPSMPPPPTGGSHGGDSLGLVGETTPYLPREAESSSNTVAEAWRGDDGVWRVTSTDRDSTNHTTTDGGETTEE